MMMPCLPHSRNSNRRLHPSLLSCILFQILVPDPYKRYSVPDICHHPWFQVSTTFVPTFHRTVVIISIQSKHTSDAIDALKTCFDAHGMILSGGADPREAGHVWDRPQPHHEAVPPAPRHHLESHPGGRRRQPQWPRPPGHPFSAERRGAGGPSEEHVGRGAPADATGTAEAAQRVTERWMQGRGRRRVRGLDAWGQYSGS